MSLIDEVDRLYEGCVTEPARWNDQAFADWADGVAQGEPIGRNLARHIRRCLAAGRRIAAFWRDADISPEPDDWRSGVDVALGNRAWRPQLDLAMAILERSPDPEVFDRVASLFPVVHHQPFLDDITYDEWLGDPSHREPER